MSVCVCEHVYVHVYAHVCVCEVHPLQLLDLPELFLAAKHPCSGLPKIAAGARLRDTVFSSVARCFILFSTKVGAALTTQNTKAGEVGC